MCVCVSVCGGGLVGNDTAPEPITEITAVLNEKASLGHSHTVTLKADARRTAARRYFLVFLKLKLQYILSECVNSIISLMINTRVT